MARLKLLHRLAPFFVLALIGVALVPLIFSLTLSLKSPVPRYAVKEFSPALISLGTKNLNITVGDQNFVVPKNEVVKWKENYTRDYSGQNDIRFNPALTKYVQNLAGRVSTEPVNAKFKFENGRVTLFNPAQDGEVLDITKADEKIRTALLSGQTTVTLNLEKVPAEITLDTINNLGINTLIAKGTSDFTGSSQARIQNIRVASGKFNGILVKPQENFSFNTILGEVEASTGYAPEKVIKNKKLVYEYGGGVCQVSTTLFRAAIFAGFPILERKPHAFPVKYYNPQGFDATIYPGVQDLKFTNNSPGHVLLQTKIEGTKLTFEIYGTDDGREVAVKGPFQYDIQPDGAMKAYFTRLTTTASDGVTKEDEFYSNYRSPDLYPLEERNPLE